MNYRELYEKHARSKKQRAIIGLALNVLGIAVNIVILKQLREGASAIAPLPSAA